jgi:integrase
VLARRLGRSHYGIALRTSDRALAKRLAARATAAMETLAEAVAMTAQDPIQPTDAELMEILREMFRGIIARGEREHLFRPENWDPDAISDYDTEEEAEAKALDDPMDRAHYWSGVLLRNAYEEIRPYVAAALRRRNRATPEPENRHRAFLRMAAGTAAEAHRILGARRQGQTLPALFPYEGWPGPSAIADAANAGPARPSVSALFADHAERKRWSPASRQKAAVAVRLFCGLVGDCAVSDIRKTDAAAFKRLLEKMPAAWAQASIYRDAAASGDLHSVLATAKALRETLAKTTGPTITLSDGSTVPRERAEVLAAPMHPKTINIHLEFFFSAFRRFIAEGEYVGENPFAALRFDNRDLRRARETANPDDTRDAWPRAHLQTLFDSPLWTGCKGATRRKEAGRVVIEDGWFWAPLIALYAGLRMEEVLQLRTADIAQMDGLPVIRVAWSSDQRRKSRSARRVVPIHPHLVEIGLLDFADEARRRGVRVLFPELPRTQPRGTLQAYYSRRFVVLRRELGIPDRHDFHALRTTFDTALERLPTTNTTLVRMAMGHSLERAHVDRGDRGHDAEGRRSGEAHQSRVFVSGQKRGVTPTIRREIRRRAGIEPVIGQMKANGHLGRKVLAGAAGDAINLILAAAGHTLRLLRAWLARLLAFLLSLLAISATAPPLPSPQLAAR